MKRKAKLIPQFEIPDIPFNLVGENLPQPPPPRERPKRDTGTLSLFANLKTAALTIALCAWSAAADLAPLTPTPYFGIYQTHLQFNEFTGELNYHTIARQEFLAQWWDPNGDGIKWTMECWSPRAGKWYRPEPGGYRAATKFRWVSVYIQPGFRYRFVKEQE